MTLLSIHSLGNVEADTARQSKRISYDASNNPIYIGTAKPGTATATAEWTIVRITYDASNNPIAFMYPSGSSQAQFSWDLKLTYTYS